MTKIEVGKTYKTREGRSARILATDLEGDFPIVGLVDNIKIVTWTLKGLSGLFSGEHRLDIMLEPEPERKSVWINWHGNNYDEIGVHETREEANKFADLHRTHVFEIITEDGNPVDVKIHEVGK